MYHVPVLLEEVIEGLRLAPGKNIVDCNLGGGGHAYQILKGIAPEGKLLGIDLDVDAITAATEVLSEYGSQLIVVQDNFSEIEQIVKNAELGHVDGVLFDLGLSQFQLEGSGRGFTFQDDQPLEMSFSHTEPRKAEGILNEYDVNALARMFRANGEFKYSSRLAGKIVEKREQKLFKTTKDLKEVVLSVLNEREKRTEHKFLSQVFQALRIEVNHELEHLKKALEGAVNVLSKDGVLAVISYHSLEDRIVKHFLKDLALDCVCPPNFPVCTCEAVAKLSILTKKPIVPKDAEIELNNKSRSAKLRIAQKI